MANTAYQSSYTGAEIDVGIGKANTAYQKPSGGIPKTDLTSAVQTSLGKADTALQSESDPVFSSSAASGITLSDITNWNSKTSNVGTITGISMNGTSIATSGVANITSVPASILTGAIPSAVTATTQSLNDNSTNIATTAYVDASIAALPEPMIFKGSLGTGGTIISLPTAAVSNTGFTYKVITAGTYASQAAKVGDTFISDGTTWNLIPSGDEPSGTVTSIIIKANSPISIDSSAAITTSGSRTISHANSGVTAGTYRSVTVNATGHVTAGTNPTTLAGYGITDAKIDNGTITLGSNSITPLTSSGTIDYAKRLYAAQVLPANTTGDADTMQLDATGDEYTVITNYNSNLKWVNVPLSTSADYGGVINVRGNDASLMMQLAWSAIHNEETSPTGSLWFRSRANKGYKNDWKQVAFTDSNVASATKLYTARTLWGQSFDGSALVSGSMTGVGSITMSSVIKMDRANGAIQFKIGTPSDANAYVTAMRTYTGSDTLAIGMETTRDSSFDTAIYGKTVALYYKNESNVIDFGLIVARNGFVGIGVASPTVKLDVNGSIATNGHIYMPNNKAIYWKDNPSSGTANDVDILEFSSSNSLHVGYGSSELGYPTYINGSYIVFRYGTSRTVGMYLSSAGKVGIGTSDPGAKLDVKGGILLGTNNSHLYATDTNGNTIAAVGIDSSNYFLLGYGAAHSGYTTLLDGNNIQFRYGTSHTAGMILNSSGNVGIGTTSPEYKLDVNGTGRFANTLTLNNHLIISSARSIYFVNSDGGNQQMIAYDANNNFVLGSTQGTYGKNTYLRGNKILVQSGTSNTEVIRITESQLVGIGTTAPTTKLDVNGSLRATSIIKSGGTASQILMANGTTTDKGWYMKRGSAYNGGSTGTHYLKVGTVIATSTVTTDIYAVFLVSSYYGRGNGILTVSFRRDSASSTTAQTNNTFAKWILKDSGIVVSNYILTYKINGNNSTINLYSKHTAAYQGHAFTLLHEGGWYLKRDDWTLYDAIVTSGDTAIPSDETQIVSTSA